MTFPLCTDCHGPATLVRCIGGQCYVAHHHADPRFGGEVTAGPFRDETAAAAWWAMTYAREGAEGPQAAHEAGQGCPVSVVQEPATEVGISKTITEAGLAALARYDAWTAPLPRWSDWPAHLRNPDGEDVDPGRPYQQQETR